MAGLADAVAAVVATFRALEFDGAPLRVFDDSTHVNPPCVWLPVPAVVFRFDKRRLEVTWTAFLIAPNTTTRSVSAVLSELLDTVAGTYPFIDATAQPLTLPGGGQPVPTYQLTWRSTVPIGVTP